MVGSQAYINQLISAGSASPALSARAAFAILSAAHRDDRGVYCYYHHWDAEGSAIGRVGVAWDSIKGLRCLVVRCGALVKYFEIFVLTFILRAAYSCNLGYTFLA